MYVSFLFINVIDQKVTYLYNIKNFLAYKIRTHEKNAYDNPRKKLFSNVSL